MKNDLKSKLKLDGSQSDYYESQTINNSSSSSRKSGLTSEKLQDQLLENNGKPEYL